MRRATGGRLGWVAGALALVVSSAAARPLAKFEPPRGCYLGAFIEHDGVVSGDYARFEQLVGRRHAAYITYSGYGRPFPTEWVKRVGRHGAAAHLGWEPNDGLDMVRDDVYMRRWARAAAATGVPIFLRFASEMNGAWTNYSGNPTQYIEKWRIVHRVMREEAPNVAMVWGVFTSPQATIPLYYPGDEYVDWVAVNIYNVYFHNNNARFPARHQDPRDLLRFVYNGYSHRKPIMIAEYAASSYCSVAGSVFEFALEKMTTLYQSLPTEFPRVKCIQWFSWDTLRGQAANNDYSLTGNPLVTACYRQLIANDYFLSQVVADPNLMRGLPLTSAADKLLQNIGPRAAGYPGLVRDLDRRAPTNSPARTDNEPEVARLTRRRLPGGAGGLPPQPALVIRPPSAPPVAAAAHTPIPAAMAAEREQFGLQGLHTGMVVTRRLPLTVYVPDEWDVRYVAFQVDGRSVYATNREPFRYWWDPEQLEPGRYELSVRIRREGDEAMTSQPIGIEVRRPQ